jgi:hypothetical protein
MAYHSMVPVETIVMRPDPSAHMVMVRCAIIQSDPPLTVPLVGML